MPIYTLNNTILTANSVIITSPDLPNKFPNLRAWYSSYVNSGVHINSLTNGAAVNQWDDLSGNGIHLTKGGQPTYNSATNSIYLGNYVTFGNTSATPLTSAIGTVFLVLRNDDTVSASYHLWFGKQTAGQQTDFASVRSTNLIYMEGAGTPARSWAHTNQGNFTLLTFTMTNKTFAGTSMRKNGNNVNYTTSGTTGNMESFISKFMIGGYIDSAGSLTAYPSSNNQYHKELIIYNRALDLSEITLIESYLNSKYLIY